MPIHFPVPIRNLSTEEFDERDKVVMRFAYASQNALGRHCDEHVYEADLARRLRAEGFREVYTQVPITVEHEGFVKLYYVDLLFDGALYELKTVSAFTGVHDAQVLNYSMLLGISHGKLINFRSARVTGRLRYSPIDPKSRRIFNVDEAQWAALSKSCLRLKAQVINLLNEWGAFLDVRLYNEALIHKFGGEPNCLVRVPISRDGLELGLHQIQSHEQGLSFVLTAFKSHLAYERTHLLKLLIQRRVSAFSGSI